MTDEPYRWRFPFTSCRFFSLYYYRRSALLFYWLHTCCHNKVLFWCGAAASDSWWRCLSGLVSGLRAASGRLVSSPLLYRVGFFIFFLSGWNIIFISLHSEWQFLKIAAHRGIFITFCGAAWVARQLFISLHLSSISLSQKAWCVFFSPPPPLAPPTASTRLPSPLQFFPCRTLLWPSRSDCLASVIHTLRFTENNIAP